MSQKSTSYLSTEVRYRIIFCFNSEHLEYFFFLVQILEIIEKMKKTTWVLAEKQTL